ncbi:MAG: nucleotidyltransferase family protein [Verrucomicrobiae bacterium]|nr:nucleotidyltransferase family protein [Verrucomicrobiae bacterium]
MICAIVLAAGKSVRMGTQKLLLPVDGQPAIARIVGAVAACPAVRDIIVVTGRDGSKVSSVLAGYGVSFVANPDYDGDMLSSLRCGIDALPGSCTAFLVVLGDQPRITSKLIETLLAAHPRHSPSAILVPLVAGRRGHPILVSTVHCESIMTGFDGIGLRGLLTADPESVVDVPFPEEYADQMRDMDTPGDYEQLLAIKGK